jgi:hypothetical protein
MTRLSSMSPAALRAVFSPESDADLIILLTIYNPQNHSQVLYRIADGYVEDPTDPTKALRLGDPTAEQVVYGVVSRTHEYTFLPVEITLPNEDDSQSPRCSVTFHDVSRFLIPFVRTQLTGPAPVLLELVLSSQPDTVEASFSGFMLTSVTYNATTVSGDLTTVNYDREPFPQHTFSPLYFPGLF